MCQRCQARRMRTLATYWLFQISVALQRGAGAGFAHLVEQTASLCAEAQGLDPGLVS